MLLLLLSLLLQVMAEGKSEEHSLEYQELFNEYLLIFEGKLEEFIGETARLSTTEEKSNGWLWGELPCREAYMLGNRLFRSQSLRGLENLPALSLPFPCGSYSTTYQSQPVNFRGRARMSLLFFINENFRIILLIPFRKNKNRKEQSGLIFAANPVFRHTSRIIPERVQLLLFWSIQNIQAGNRTPFT